MSTVQEIERRLPRFISAVLCLTVGIIVGYRLGDFVGQIFIYVLAGNVSPKCFSCIVYMLSRLDFPGYCEITQVDIQKAIYFCKSLFSFIGMVYLAFQMTEVHHFYYYLRGIKTQHNFKYYRFRHYFLEIDNRHIDMVYSLIYVLIKGSIPLLLCIIAGAVSFTMTVPFLSYISLIVALFAMVIIFSWSYQTIWWLLHPHRIEWEIKDADIIQGVFARKEMEDKLLQQNRNKSDEDDDDDE